MANGILELAMEKNHYGTEILEVGRTQVEVVM